MQDHATNNYKNKLGFSIIEVMVAIYIITMGLMGVFSLVSQNIRVQQINKNNLVASQLAQEGLELVRNIRDENWITVGSEWNEDLSASTFAIDYRGRNDKDDNADDIDDAEARLYINSTTDFYTHLSSGNTATSFYRLITINSVTADSINVVCLVQWAASGQEVDYKAETMLYNWR